VHYLMLRIWVALSATLVALLAYSLSGIASRLLRIVVHHPATSADAVRFGLLGAAKIAPHGLLYPARMYEGATVVAVGARDPSRARALAERWGIPRSGDYASVLADESVEAVYIPLLNGLHYEWAAAALRAGKHVLCEKPLTSNAAEADALAALAAERGLVLFEAFHWLYHPVAARLSELVGDGTELGAIRHLEVSAGLPSPDAVKAALGFGGGGGGSGAGGSGGGGGVGSRPSPPPPPPKMDAALGGGNFMGQGCYTVSVARRLLGEPLEVINATMREAPPAGSGADISTVSTHTPRRSPSPSRTHTPVRPPWPCPSSRVVLCSLALPHPPRRRLDNPWMRSCRSLTFASVAAPPPRSARRRSRLASTCRRRASAAASRCATISSRSCTTTSTWHPPPPPRVAQARRGRSVSTAAERRRLSCSCVPLWPPSAAARPSPPRQPTPPPTCEP